MEPNSILKHHLSQEVKSMFYLRKLILSMERFIAFERIYYICMRVMQFPFQFKALIPFVVNT